MQASACSFTKSNTPPWVSFTFFKLYNWYQIAQRITYDAQLTHYAKTCPKSAKLFPSKLSQYCSNAF